jgi:hypothetical protein
MKLRSLLIAFVIVFALSFLWLSSFSQVVEQIDATMNTAENQLNDQSKLTIGGYAQVDYNQPINSGTKNNGKLDVHRLVLMFGYKFNERLQFITELEVEHVKEVFVEQAFLNYRVTDWLNIRGGLMLIPMGIINELHEPPTFNGVERPSTDYYIVPTTWREIGLGFSGRVDAAKIKYQLYLVNGFISYDGEARLSGKYALRNARQKGAKAITMSPNITGKLEFYGLSGLTIGISGYFGKTQSSLYKNIETSETDLIARADSSIVGISMAGLDARYAIKGFFFRGQYNYGSFNNTQEYNEFTGSDFGSSMSGYYLEVAYNVFHEVENIKGLLLPFIRIENYDTQQSVAGNLEKNDAYNRQEITFGIGWRPVTGVAMKAWSSETLSLSATSQVINI